MLSASLNKFYSFICKLYRTKARMILLRLFYLFQTSAPWILYISYIKTKLKKNYLKKYQVTEEQFKKLAENKTFSSDWFTHNIPYWMYIFEKYDLQNKNIQALEIGSWEGRSSLFIMTMLPGAMLTCVDTWEGADEHVQQEVLNTIEKSFDANLEMYAPRLAKFKGTSLAFFNSHAIQTRFDLIYVDGSHHCDDVILDLIKGFEILKVGGILIIDDYFWSCYRRETNNPAYGVNAFLRLKGGMWEAISLSNHQLIIRKTLHDNRDVI